MEYDIIAVLDTNAYRGLACKILKYPEFEREKKTNLIKTRLLKSKIVIQNNYWVISEILNHLESEEDPSYEECALALKILCNVSSTCFTNYKIICNETIETEIFKNYNEDEYKKHKQNERDILLLATEFVINGRSSKFLKYIPNITNQLASYKRDKLAELNNKKGELKRKIFHENLPQDFRCDLSLLNSMLCHIVEPLTGKNCESLNLEEKKELSKRYSLGMARRVQVLYNAVSSGKTSSLGKKFARHFIDMVICDDFPLFQNSILITDDGENKGESGIKSTFKYFEEGHRCISLDSFLSSKLSLNQDLLDSNR